MTKKWWIVVLAAVVVAVILLLSNPSRNAHMESIREQQSSLAETGVTIAAEALGAFEYNNYGLFSTVTSGEDNISFGMLGNVWVDSDDR